MTRETESKESRRPIDATILFADMVDSSMLSHVYEPWQYDAVVSEFHLTAAEVIKQIVTEGHFQGCRPHVEASVRGDELCLILGCIGGSNEMSRTSCHPNRCAWTALQVAVRLKRAWLLSQVNRDRIDNVQPPLEIAIGIHAGPVIVREHTRFEGGDILLPARTLARRTAEGYAINTAKRVETVSRSGRFSRIFLTRPIYNRTPFDFRPAFVRADPPELKGIPVAPIIYEAKGIGHFDDKCFPNTPEFEGDGISYYERVVATNPDQLWLLLDLAHHYYDRGEYEKAAVKYKGVLEADSSFAPAYAYLGRTHFRSYRLPEARAALERSLQLDPGQARANHFLGVCYRREALMSLYNGQPEISKELFKRSIEHHQTACRIAELENMDYPWAENGLISTVAQSMELDVHGIALARPFGLDKALTRIDELLVKSSPSVGDTGKSHLLLHTKAVVLLHKRQYGPAREVLIEGLDALEKRKKEDRGIPPDEKAYAEKRGEMLFHLGKCKLLIAGGGGIDAATQDWRQARQVLLSPYRTDEEQRRVLTGQYWINSFVMMPDGTRTRVSDYFK